MLFDVILLFIFSKWIVSDCVQFGVAGGDHGERDMRRGEGGDVLPPGGACEKEAHEPRTVWSM